MVCQSQKPTSVRRLANAHSFGLFINVNKNNQLVIAGLTPRPTGTLAATKAFIQRQSLNLQVNLPGRKLK